MYENYYKLNFIYLFFRNKSVIKPMYKDFKLILKNSI